MLPVFGGDSYTRTDNYMVGRTNGVATYRNNDFFGLVNGLNFALQYQGANEGANANENQEGTKMAMMMFVSRTATASVCQLPMTSISVCRWVPLIHRLTVPTTVLLTAQVPIIASANMRR